MESDPLTEGMRVTIDNRVKESETGTMESESVLTEEERISNIALFALKMSQPTNAW
jgi:hypothetical protein